MRLLVLTLVAVLAAIASALVAQYFGGRVVVHIADFTVDISLLMALLLGICAFFVLSTSIWIAARLLSAPRNFHLRRRRRRRQKADALLAQGLRSWLLDQPDEAQRQWQQAAQQDPKQSLLHILAAAAAIRTDQLSEWEPHLRAVTEPEYQPVCALLQADGLMAAHEWEKALAVLQAPDRCDPKHPRTLRHLARCYRELGSWMRLLEHSQSSVTHSQLPQVEIQQWWREAAQHLCEHADGPELHALWPKLGTARDDITVLHVYLQGLHRCNQEKPELETYLRDRHPDDAAVELYANLPGTVTKERIRCVTQWLEREPERIVVLRALARLYARLGNWNEALNYLQVAARLGPESDAALCWELTEAYEHLGMHEQAHESCRRGLQAVVASEKPGY